MKWVMSDFLTERVVVKCNNFSEVVSFLKECEAFHLTWSGGTAAIDFLPNEFPAVIMFNEILHHIYWSSSPEKFGDGLVEWKDYYCLKASTPVKYKVEIECDGTTTTAKLIVDDQEVKSTTAKKHPDDKFNLHLGMETAFNRLWERQKTETTPAATTIECGEHKFNIGDRVIYVKPEAGFEALKGWSGKIVKTVNCGLYHYGMEFDRNLRVAGQYSNDCDGTADRDHGLFVFKDSIIPEPPKKEIVYWGKSPATGNHLRFHEGDRVIFTGKISSSYNNLRGMRGTIIKVEQSGHFDYAMEFDKCIIGKDVYLPVSIEGKPGHCIWVDDQWITPEIIKTT